MKHIGIVVPSFHISSETFVVTEINALVKAGHKVSVLTFEDLNECSNLNKNVEVIIIKRSISKALTYALNHPVKAFNGALAATKFSSISITSLFGLGLNIGDIIKEQKISHIHCHFMHAPLAYAIVGSKTAGITVSSIGHGHDVYVNDSDIAQKLSMCDFSVAVCNDMVSKLNEYKAGKVELLHCGVDLHLFNSKPSRLNESVKLLFIGRLVEKKGLQFLFPAIKKLSRRFPITLDIVGDGPLVNDYRLMCEELGITEQVRFLGRKTPFWISQNAVNYSALVAPFCVSGNGDRDTGPLVLKEAMASGIPVITTELMGAKEIVDDSVGFKCEPSSIEGLENVLVKFCELTPYQRYIKGTNARRTVASKYNASSQAKKLSMWVQGL